jgi:hypothetical protein
MKRIPLILSTFFAITSLSAQTVKVHDHRYPEQETVFDTEWEISGTHHFRYKIFFSVFTGAYYRPVSGEGERLVFTYTRDIKADDLRAQAMKHLESTQSEEVLQRYQNLTDELQAAYEDVSDGDSYAITVLPDKGIWLTRDGTTVFQSDNAEFGDWYLDIWLGDPPIDDGLKEALLGE